VLKVAVVLTGREKNKLFYFREGVKGEGTVWGRRRPDLATNLVKK
jgi:hypothetical protein